MKKISSLIKFITPLVSTMGFFALSSSCKQNIEKITIAYEWENPGFSDKEKQKFNELLKNRYLEIKNKFNEFKNINENVEFELKTNYDKNALWQDLITDKKNILDLGFVTYEVLSQNISDENDFRKTLINWISQTETLQFTWSLQNHEKYVDGSFNDPLRKSAILQNQIQFEKSNGEFPTWNNKLDFDGSKFTQFYSKDKTTPNYRGCILISGSDEQRKQIVDAWDKKDWNKFLSYGIIYKKHKSASGFKTQVDLLSQHFSKSKQSLIKELLDENNQNVLRGKHPAEYIGKQWLGKTYNIGFASEGEFNWTQYDKDKKQFQPDDFPNAKVRVLTMTNPLFYNVLVARTGMLEPQVKLLQKVFNSLTIEENELGKFTGFNKFSIYENNTEYWKNIEIYKRI